MMLEFYFKFYPTKFEKKTIELIAELRRIFFIEGIEVLTSSNRQDIEDSFCNILSDKTSKEINDIFFTIRSGGLQNHFLIKKYLPETRKKEPIHGPLMADFFAGAGGLSLGMMQAGFSPGFVNDHDIEAIETYYFNHDLPINRYFVGDIRDFIRDIDTYAHLLKDIKVVIGGPPCQGFSMANRQRLLDDPRNELYKDFLIILGKIQPDFFIMENVSGMKNKVREIENDIEKFTGIHYEYAELILNAKDFDVPQNRERYFLIGNKVRFGSLKLEMMIHTLRRSFPKYVLDDALFGLPPIKTNPKKLSTSFESDENGYMIRKSPSYNSAFLDFINGDNSTHGYVFNHKSRYNQPRDLEIFDLLPQAGNSLHDSIAHLMPYHNRNDVFKDKYYRLDPSRISKTITAHMKHDCNSYIHPTQARGLSPREAARIQTFPDDYVFRGLLNDWYQQIGNAVPVKLAKMLGDQLITHYQTK